MTKVKRNKSFYVGNIELKVGENDGFVEERNYFDEEGRLISTEADRGDKDIIETIYEYDEKGRNTKITSTIRPKVKLINPRKANPALNNSIVVELSYDDQDRLVEVLRNGLVAETWEYAKTGRITHMSYRDENYGLCDIKEVIDKNGDLVLRNVVAGGQQISKFSKTCIRGIYSITEENKAEGGVYCIRKSRIRKEGDKEILISNSEIESAPGFRSAKELLEIRYNDNNDIEYMKTKETVNGMVNITEKNCIYKNGKLHSVVDGNGHEEIYKYTTKNKYEVVRSMPTDLMSMLNHLYEYDITKETKKATYHFVGTTKEMQFTIEHKEDSKDQFQFSTSFIIVADDNPNVDIHCVKDNMTIDLLHDENDYIVVVQYEDETGKKISEVRHRSADNTAFKPVYDLIMNGSRGKEIQKFITDVKAIVK